MVFKLYGLLMNKKRLLLSTVLGFSFVSSFAMDGGAAEKKRIVADGAEEVEKHEVIEKAKAAAIELAKGAKEITEAGTKARAARATGKPLEEVMALFQAERQVAGRKLIQSLQMLQAILAASREEDAKRDTALMAAAGIAVAAIEKFDEVDRTTREKIEAAARNPHQDE